MVQEMRRHCPTEVESGKLSRLLGFEVQFPHDRPATVESVCSSVWSLQNGALPGRVRLARPPGEEAYLLPFCWPKCQICGVSGKESCALELPTERERVRAVTNATAIVDTKNALTSRHSQAETEADVDLERVARRRQRSPNPRDICQKQPLQFVPTTASRTNAAPRHLRTRAAHRTSAPLITHRPAADARGEEHDGRGPLQRRAKAQAARP